MYPGIFVRLIKLISGNCSLRDDFAVGFLPLIFSIPRTQWFGVIDSKHYMTYFVRLFYTYCTGRFNCLYNRSNLIQMEFLPTFLDKNTVTLSRVWMFCTCPTVTRCESERLYHVVRDIMVAYLYCLNLNNARHHLYVNLNIVVN